MTSLNVLINQPTVNIKTLFQRWNIMQLEGFNEVSPQIVIGSSFSNFMGLMLSEPRDTPWKPVVKISSEQLDFFQENIDNSPEALLQIVNMLIYSYEIDLSIINQYLSSMDATELIWAGRTILLSPNSTLGVRDEIMMIVRDL